jgi:hypothetical protein
MKATAWLVDQHRQLERLLAALETQKLARLPLLLELVEQLTTHLAIEDHVFYWEVRDRVDLPLDPFQNHHASTKKALVRAVVAEVDDVAFAERLEDLRLQMAEHVRQEEGVLMPRVEAIMTPTELDALGKRMQAFYTTVLKDPNGERSSAEPPVAGLRGG